MFQDVYFVVFDHEQQLIIFQDSLQNGKVAWKSDFEIEAFANNKGPNKQYKKEHYIYGVRTRKKLTY